MTSVVGSELEGEVNGVEMPEDEGEVGFERVRVVCFAQGDSEMLEEKRGWEGSQSGWSLGGCKFGGKALGCEGSRGSDVEVEGVDL